MTCTGIIISKSHLIPVCVIILATVSFLYSEGEEGEGDGAERGGDEHGQSSSKDGKYHSQF